MAIVNNPTIPTDITVHLGAPDEAAPNITVPFVEYIKNVASNEIYPTWPTDAIKANVLAQISFALNRIYNEWYPSQGYNFDITNSPIYDQNFKQDGQFFETISLIVDDIFNNYIVRNGQIQPLFAQYCDGKTTTCDGLSQWGSVEQAQLGKNPLEILKYYYGEDISIVYNAPVDANIISYPGFPIGLGSAGNFVKIIKTQLNRIGNNYPAIPAITDENQFFTVETEQAVKTFQNIFNLEETGIVDKSTWYKIKYIYNAVKQISDLYSEGITLEEAQLIFDKTLQKGDSGVQIQTLNYLIRVIAYFDNDIPLLEAQETFNENTEQMIIAFQNKYGLEPTGIVNAETWKAIIEAYDQTLQTIPNDLLIYEDEFFPGIFLSRGMTGEDVLRLQRFLLKICFNTHSIPGVRVNGVYDSLTEQSVRAIQRKYNLVENGAVGPYTWYYIVEMSKQQT